MEDSGNALDYSLTMSGELGAVVTPKGIKPATPASEASKALLAAAQSFGDDNPSTPNNVLAQATKELEKKKATPDLGNISQALKKAAGVVDREERVEVRDLTSKANQASKFTPKKAMTSPTRKNMASSGAKKVLGSSSKSNDGVPLPKPSRRNPPLPRKTLSSSANNPFASVSRSSGEFLDLPKYQQAELRNMSSTAKEYLYGFGTKVRKSKENKAERSKSLRSSWERLSKSEDTGKKAKKKAHGSYSDAKNCTFKPKITKWKGGEQKEDDDEDAVAVDEKKRLLLFVKKQDASTRNDRRDKEHKQKKRDYELRLDRLQCRNCGNMQSYDEYVEKRMKCPADICSHGSFYQPQVIFKRDLLKGFKR